MVKGEQARILCVEKSPHFEWAHRLTAPKIVNGQPAMKTYDRKDGTSATDFDYDFIGMPHCFGDYGILQDKGVDVKNCPACAKSVESDMVQGPQRRFAMNVIKYATRQGTFELATPFSVSVIVWRFSDSIFNKLTDFKEEWGSLQEHDLLLGPCTNQVYQKFEIAIAARAAWMENEQHKNLVVLTYRENKAPDLSIFCGRKVDRRWLDEDLQKIEARFTIARGHDDSTAGALGDGMDLAAGLGNLLEDTQPETAPAPPQPAPAAAGITDEVAAAADISPFDAGLAATAPAAPPQQAPAPAEQAPATKVLSTEELLGGGEQAAAPQPPVAQPPATPPVAQGPPQAPVTPTPEQAPAPPAASQEGLDDLLSQPAPAVAAPAEPEPAKPGSSGETVSFEDLLADLG